MDLTLQQIQDKLFHTILDHSHDAIIFVDAVGTIKVWSKSAEILFDIKSDEAIGQTFAALALPESTIKNWQAEFDSAPSPENDNNIHRVTQIQIKLANGLVVWVDQTIHRFEMQGELWAYVELRDAESRIRRESELEREATTDVLSQLPNRRRFQSVIESQIDSPLTLAIIDIDNFKSINDQYGHEVGDEAIRIIAKQLNQTFGNTNTSDNQDGSAESVDLDQSTESTCAARLGGDEFGVVMKTESIESAQERFNEFCSKIASTKLSSDHAIQLTVSIGVAVATKPLPARDLLKAADQLMYQSKENGRNQVSLNEIE